MHEENNIAKRYWQTFSTMKILMLIDSNLSINSWAEAIDISNYLQNLLLIKQAKKSIIIPEEI